MSGIYVLLHPVNTGEYTVVKIGYSTDINRRMKDSCYNTMFWGDYRPKLIFKALIETTAEDLKYIENSIHRALSQYRVDPRKELFYNITTDAMKNIFDHYQIQCTVDEGVETIICDTKPVEDPKFDVIERPVLDELNNLVDTNTVAPMKHQVDIINTLLNTYYPVSGYKGKLVLPCGYGKLWISLFTMRMMDNGYNCLYVVMGPSTILVEQFLEAAVKVMPDWNVLVYDGTRKDVTIGTDRPTLIITTYHSADQLSAIIGERVPRLVVYDEAHRTCTIGDEPGQFRNTLSLFPQSNKLFMTATERIVIHDSSGSSGSESSGSGSSGFGSSGSGSSDSGSSSSSGSSDSGSSSSEDEDINDDGDEEEENEDCAGTIRGVLSMDDELVYGSTIISKTFENAIADGIICDYRVAVPTENSESVDVVHHALYNLSIHHLLVYNNTLAESFDLCNALTARGIRAYHIDGTMSSSKRNEILRQFGSDSVAVLCSCKTLTEGVSVPIVDSVYFADPRSSEIDITQCIGRALRLHSSKTLATIITPSSMLKSRGFLSTLITMDVRNKTPGVLRKKMMSVPNGMVLSSAANEGTKTLLDQMSRYVGFVIMGKNDGIWEYKLGLVLDYERSSGKMVTGKAVHYGQWIGPWLNKQRMAYKAGDLSYVRTQRLIDSMTFKSWLDSRKRLKTRKWGDILQLIIECEGTTKGMITQSQIYANESLGTWLNYQKQKYKKGKLNSEKSRQLMSSRTFSEWISSGKHLDLRETRKTWDQVMDLLLDYESTVNSTVVIKTVHRETRVGAWLDRQKQSFKNGKLPDEKYQSLMRSVSFSTWISSGSNLKTQAVRMEWNKILDLAVQYEETTGKIITGSANLNGVKIGSWMSTQKSLFKSGKMDESRKILMMKSATFSYWINNGKHLIVKSPNKPWIQYLDLLLDYETNTGKIAVKSTLYKNEHIGNWVDTQRQSYKSGRLDDDKLQQLMNSTSFATWFHNSGHLKTKTPKIKLEAYILAILNYENSTTCNVTRSTSFEGINIGQWIDTQKQTYKKNKLSTEKLQQLRTTRTWSAWEPNNYNPNYPPI